MCENKLRAAELVLQKKVDEILFLERQEQKESSLYRGESELTINQGKQKIYTYVVLMLTLFQNSAFTLSTVHMLHLMWE